MRALIKGAIAPRMVLCVLLVFLLSGCSAPQTHLVGDFTSGISQQGFLAQTVTSKAPSFTFRGADPYVILQFSSFNMNGQKGSLRAEFYLDELCELAFYPDDYEAFTKSVLGKIYKPGQTFSVTKSNLRIANADEESRPGVSFKDIQRSSDLTSWVLANT